MYSLKISQTKNRVPLFKAIQLVIVHSEQLYSLLQMDAAVEQSNPTSGRIHGFAVYTFSTGSGSALGFETLRPLGFRAQ